MSDSLGALVCRLEVSASDQRVLGWVRGVAAVSGLACSVLLLLGRVPVAVFLAALLGLIMGLVWLGQAARATRAARAPSRHALLLYERGFELCDAQKVTRVLFADVRSIEQDDDLLDVLVHMRDGSRVRVEPRYPGLAIHELVHKLQSAAERAQAASA